MKWIKVSDELPTRYRKVIAYGLYDSDIPNDWGVNSCVYDNGEWVILQECCSEDFKFQEVTHWMEMPEKPNEMD